MTALVYDSTADPTLEAVDKAIEDAALLEPQRGYLGFSSLGNPCERKLWYDFRNAEIVRFKAKTLKCFEDGFAGEDLQAKRLRMVKGIKLETHGKDGKQIGWEALSGHMKGHCDGVITGLLQAPKTAHIWEHKQVNPDKFKKLLKLKSTMDEKAVLEQWDAVYYAQAVLYMGFSGHTRHYLTCSTPGGRETASIRTNENPELVKTLMARAERIVFSDEAPLKLSHDPEFFQCKWCDHAAICHGTAMPRPHCKVCTHATPEREGGWSCDWYKTSIPEQFLTDTSCPDHRYLPHLLGNFADYTNGNEAGNQAEYLNKLTGNYFYNCEGSGHDYPSKEIYAAQDKRALGNEAVSTVREGMDAEVVG